MIRKCLFAAAFLVASATSVPAQGPALCKPYKELIAALKNNVGEVPQNTGTNNEHTVITQLLANPETGTWTIIQIDQTGMACIMSGGVRWQYTYPEIPGTDS